MSLEGLPKAKIKLNRDGNAVSTIIRCQRALRKVGWTPDQCKGFYEEAISGDYGHVLRTAMKYCE